MLGIGFGLGVDWIVLVLWVEGKMVGDSVWCDVFGVLFGEVVKFRLVVLVG